MKSTQSNHQNFPHLNIQQAITTFQNHCSTFLQNFSHLPLFNPVPSSFQTHLQASLFNLQTHSKRAINAAVSHFNPIPPCSSKTPIWARLSSQEALFQRLKRPGTALSDEVIEERLAGVPVYGLANPDEEFVMVSERFTGKSLGLLCFKREDAEALLEQMKVMNPVMRKSGSKVVPLALNKVLQVKVDGVAFRFIPDPSQIKKAIQLRNSNGASDDDFPGVPVFQSRSLMLMSEKKSYRPVFFRKEDLDKSILQASRQQNRPNPVFREGDIQVASFEEIVNSMKDASSSTWDDVVFIPPGFDVSTYDF